MSKLSLLQLDKKLSEGVSAKDRDRKNIVHSTRDGVYGFCSSIDEVNVKELLCCNAGEL
jgi:hypothetical protein